MVVPAASDVPVTLETTERQDRSRAEPQLERPARRGRLLRLVLFVILTLAVLAAAAVLVWALAGRRGEAEDQQRAREDVMAQAEQFMMRINTYGPDQLDGTEMPKYRKSVAEVITPKFDADFEKNVPAAEATVAQAGLARVTQVFGTGISAIDADSATALVSGSFTNSYPKSAKSTTRVDAEPSPFRVQVELVKTDGRWLVDDFSPVNTAESSDSSGSTGTTTPLPSTDATTDPTTAPSSQGTTP